MWLETEINFTYIKNNTLLLCKGIKIILKVRRWAAACSRRGGPHAARHLGVGGGGAPGRRHWAGWDPALSHGLGGYPQASCHLLGEGPHLCLLLALEERCRNRSSENGGLFRKEECDCVSGTAQGSRSRVHHPRDFPGGPVVKNPPYNAGDKGSIPGWGTKIPHAAGQLSPRAPQLRSLRTSTRACVLQTTELTHSGTHAPQPEKRKSACDN